ncbi:hypothetical protein [Ktedonobacter sp. SOSP1-85]|uniref:hypothetical protein n=1 Tax=Ktedonobacter sp. SOSP1-85 TaxID=2778367 RepID=UPI001915A207|nr:hypothetical protein [Ktedonobacter sp. SOSP1-85]
MVVLLNLCAFYQLLWMSSTQKKLAALVRRFAAGGMTIALFFVIMTPIWERKTIVFLSQIGNFTQKEAMKWRK